jgi:hypothetical protein
MAAPLLVPLLLGLVGSIVGRVLFALGFTVVTIIGVEAAIGELKSAVVSGAMGLPTEILSLFLIGGGGVCVNLIFSAISFRLAYWAITKSVRVLGVKA